MTIGATYRNALFSVARLSNSELRTQLTLVVQRHNQLTAELLIHLGEVDARRLYLDWASSSLFRHCVDVLGFSEDVAYKRIAAARLARRFPSVLDLISTGRIHLSGLLLIAPYLTPQNHADLLSAACGKTKRQALFA